MEIGEKLNILADAAKYDVSCSSSGSSRKDMAGGLGNAKYSGMPYLDSRWAVYFSLEDTDDECLYLRLRVLCEQKEP